MKRYLQNLLIGALGAGALLAFGATGAYATQTSPGTSVGNKASVNYQVGGVPQTVINSSPDGNSTPGADGGADTTFVVDKLLALSVVTTNTTLVTTSPGAASAVTAFKVFNLGNANQSAHLTAVKETAVPDPFGNESGNSDFVVTTAATYADSNGDGIYEPGTDPAISSIASLAPVASTASANGTTIFVVSSIPLTPTNGQWSVVGLVAQVGDENGGAIGSDDSSTPWTPNAVQQIFAETSNTGIGNDIKAYDGYAADDSGYIVSAPVLTVTKAATVISDPVSASGNAPDGYTPKAIPGAVMMYTITVANASDASNTATGITITDDLSTQSNLDLSATEASIKAMTNGGTTDSCGSGGVTCTFTGNVVTVSGLTADAGKTAKVTFEVTIK